MTAIRTITADDTAGPNDHTLIVDATAAAVTIALPPAISAGRVYTVKKVDGTANTVTLDADGSELIEGAAMFVISTQYDAPQIQSDGTGWWLV